MFEIKILENGGYELKVVEARHDVVTVLRKPPPDVPREQLRRAIRVYLNRRLTPLSLNCLNQRHPTSKIPQDDENKGVDFDCTASG